jgi:hypothetical protein
LSENVIDRIIVGVLIVAIKRENASRELIHNIGAGGTHYHILDEGRGGITVFIDSCLIKIEVILGGKRAHKKQPRRFGITEVVVTVCCFDDIVDTDTAIEKLTFTGDSFIFVDKVSVNVAYSSDARENAGTV